MPNLQLAAALRVVVNQYALTNAAINLILANPFTENDIGAHLGRAVNTVRIRQRDIARDLIAAMTLGGGAWNGHLFDLVGWHLTPGVQRTTTEDLSAMTRLGLTNTSDPVRTLTNLLRFIRAAERPNAV